MEALQLTVDNNMVRGEGFSRMLRIFKGKGGGLPTLGLNDMVKKIDILTDIVIVI